jgi:hypothetical protein
MGNDIKTALTIHVIVIGIGLGMIALLLIRRGMFTWKHTGFWAWSAFLIYFFLNPVFVLLENSTYRYETVLNAAGGVGQVYSVLLAIGLGIFIYYLVYLSASASTVNWGISKDFEISGWKYLIVMLPFIGLAIYSLWYFRSGLGAVERYSAIENGRFVGEVIGYESVGHLLFFFPVITLVLQKQWRWYLLGLLLAGCYVVLTIPHGYSRYATVSMMVAVAIADTIRRSRAWPRLAWLIIIVALTGLLQLRGHAAWNISTMDSEITELLPDVAGNLPNTLSAREVSMLGNFYLKSYYADKIGYSYGLPTINYLLTGWIPGRFFPQKYFLVDLLNARMILSRDAYIDRVLRNVKFTLLGSFYADGGLIAVVLEMAFVGWLTRKIDGMLKTDAPIIVQTLAICWLSMFWMMWGGAMTWALVRIGLLSMPAFVLWLASPKSRRPESPQVMSPWPI